MRELINKLSVTDGDAATALRVISHFEALVDQRAPAAAMVRAAAALAGCPAGLHDAGGGQHLVFDETGRRLTTNVPVPGGGLVPADGLTATGGLIPTGGPAPADGVALADGATPVNAERWERLTVWLVRAGAPGPLDQLILERCARSVDAVARTRDAHPSVAAIRIACDADSSLAERRAAVRHLGLGPTIMVVATSVHATGLPPGPILGERRIHLLEPRTGSPTRSPATVRTPATRTSTTRTSPSSATPVAAVPSSATHASGAWSSTTVSTSPRSVSSSAAGAEAGSTAGARSAAATAGAGTAGVGGGMASLAGLPSSVAAGFTVCSADELPDGWRRAVTALRLAVDPRSGGPAHVRYEQLGSLAALAEQFDAVSAAAVPDVRRVEELRGQRPWVTGVIDVVLNHRSVREAARQLNLHHSTLHQRITWLEGQLGYALTEPRAAITLTLWRIAQNI